MFKRQTLFVLGAGSSKEVDLPLGTELAAIIGKKMDIRFDSAGQRVESGDHDLFRSVAQQCGHQEQEVQQAAWLIRDGIGLAQSIDDFLDLHRTKALVNLYGKAAIVKSVLEAEMNSKLYYGGTTIYPTFDPDRFADTWFVKFMHMLGRGIPKENVREIFDHVSFIIFNYDRCVEHFLVNALQKLYGIRWDEASAIVDDLHIIHPYGDVGTVPFGAIRANYVELAGGIKTYTEQIADAVVVQRVQAEMERSECIVFLGFAYHSQNMMIFQPRKAMPHTKFVYGTAYGMSDADVDVVTHRIAGFYTPTMSSHLRSQRIRLENKLTSARLFDNYARSLSGGD
jgi:hypothetical protein